MPSGFVQDTNQLQPNFYRVTIDCTDWNAATNTTGGGLSPNSSDSFSTANLPTTAAEATLRARANMRWRNVVNRLTNVADCQILDVTVAGESNGDDQPDTVTFTVKFERDAGVIAACGATTYTPTTGGAVTVDTVAKALRYVVSQGVADATTATVRVASALGEGMESVTVAAPDTIGDIYDDVGVSLIDTTTLVTS
jgi:hypothetical protein